MEIKKVKITNYGGVENFELPDSKLIALCGGNGHGKSTIVDSIRFLLTGKNSYAIRDGAAEAVVSGEMFGTKVARHMFIDRKGSVSTEVRLNGRKTTIKSFNEWLVKNGLQPDALRLTTSSEVLAAMNSSELSEFFIKGGYLPVTIPKEDIMDMLALPPAEAAVLSGVLPEGDVSLDDVSEAYNNLYETRRSIKRFIVQLREVMKPAGDTLEELKKKREDILKREGAASSVETAWRSYDAAVKAVNAAINQAADVRREISVIAETKDLTDEIKKAVEKLQECQKILNQIEANLKIMKEQYTLNKELLEKLDSDRCPLSGDIVCRTDKTPIKTKLTASQEAISAEVKKSLARMEKGKKIITDLNVEIEELRSRQKLFEKRKVLEERLKKIIVPPSPETPTVAREKGTVDFKAEKNKIDTQIAAWDAYEKYLKDLKEQEELKQKVTNMNTVIELLAPKGALAASILSIACEDLEKIANEQAEKISPHMRLHFEASEGLQITAITKAGGPQLQINALSTGEKSIALLLVMDLLNQLSSGFRMLLIDDFEKFDTNNMSGLIKMIRDSGSDALIGFVDHENIINDISPLVDDLVKI